MNAIADSEAFFDPGRMLAQHQAALTLLQNMLSDPDKRVVKWLDLACGRGQIISHLQKNLSQNQRKKLAFYGYDIDNSNTRTAEKTVESMDLASHKFEIGELGQFWQIDTIAGPFDFITLTNTVHEIHPATFAEILIRCIERLDENGILFIYDMEKLPEQELGAVLWTATEIKKILSLLFRAIGSECDEPAVGTWTHRTCNGWNAQIQKSHLRLPGGFQDRINETVMNMSKRISKMLEEKLQTTQKALEALTKYGSETEEESANKEDLLFQFWAISRALKGKI